MKRNDFIFVVVLLLLPYLTLQAQVRAEYEFSEDLYDKETVFGFNFNTYGGVLGGLSFKIARKIRHRHFHRFSIDVINIRHPKEERVQTQVGGSYVRLKHNYLYIVRPHYGREYTLFRKAEEKGIQVNAMISAGFSAGLLAPYLIEYQDTMTNTVKVEQFDVNTHQSSFIKDAGSILESVYQSQIQLGVSAKAGLTFEFGAFKESVLGLEMGFVIDVFTKKLIILQRAENASIYPAAYVIFYFGGKK